MLNAYYDRHFFGILPENKKLFFWNIPEIKKLFSGSLPENKKLFSGSLLENKKLFSGIVEKDGSFILTFPENLKSIFLEYSGTR